MQAGPHLPQHGRKERCDMKYKKEEIEEDKKYLMDILPVGGTCYTQVTSVAKSGMSRKMKFFAVKDGEIINVTWRVATVLGDSVQHDGTIRVSGCGMDMGFHMVYNLSRTLYGDVKCKESDSGYALKQRWL